MRHHLVLLLVVVFGATVCAATDSSHAITSDYDVDFDSMPRWLRRLTGAEEVKQHQQGYNRGRIEEIQRRATSFGAGLAIVIIACLIVWGLTAYGSWRLHHIRRGARPSVMPAQMMAPMMPVMSPQPLPMGPKLVSQRVVGNAPPGFQPGAVRLA